MSNNATAKTQHQILTSLQGCEIVLSMPYKGNHSLDGYTHPSILVLRDGRVIMPVLRIESDKVALRKFLVLGKLLPALEDGSGLFVSPLPISTQLEVNLDAIASRLKDYRWEGNKITSTAKTANKALVINIAL